jgi:hypothetical protein
MGIDALFICLLILLGLWLESINGKRGLVDEYFTWAPMGLGGIIWVTLERTMA